MKHRCLNDPRRVRSFDRSIISHLIEFHLGMNNFRAFIRRLPFFSSNNTRQHEEKVCSFMLGKFIDIRLRLRRQQTSLSEEEEKKRRCPTREKARVAIVNRPALTT